MTQAGSPNPSVAKSSGARLLRIGLYSVLGLFGAAFAAFLIVGFAVDLGGLVRDQVTAQLPKVEEKIGRKVRVGRTKLKLLPKLTLQVSDIAIEAAPGQTGIAAQPLLQIAAVRARVAVWPALVSLGRRLEVDTAEVDDLKIQVVRGADGHLSYEDILDKLDDQPEESKPLTQEQIDRLAGISITRAALRGGAVSFYDLSTPYGAAAPIKVDQIDFTLQNARLFQSFPLTLDMAILSSSQNFHFGLTVGPLPSDLKVTAPLSIVRHVELKLRPLQLEPLIRFLPPAPGIAVQKSLLEADLALDNPEGSGDLRVSASVKARGLVLEDAAAPATLVNRRRGAPTDIGVAGQLSANLIAGDVKVERFELSVGDMAVKGNADLRSLWSSPAVNMLSLQSQGLLLERLVMVLPPTTVPADATLRGPLTIRGAGSGTPTQAKVEVALDATAAALLLPSFAKPVGTPLVLELRGQVKDKGMTIERLGLVLGPLALLASGQVRSGSDFDLKADTGSVDLDRLLRLLPTVEQSMATVKKKKKARIAGDFRVFGTVKRHGEELDAGVKVQMRDAQLAAGDIELRGGADLGADLRSTPASASVNANLDLTSAGLRVPGSVDKGSGVPMRVRLQADRTGKVVHVKLAQLELPGGTLQVVGSADLSGNRLDMKVPLCDLDLSKLSQVVPALSRGSLGGLFDSRIHFAVSADGNPNKLSTVRARIDQFSLQVAGGTVRGTAEVIGLDEPRKITFNFGADYLDLDKILPPPSDSGDSAHEETHASSATAVPKFVKRLEMDGKVAVASGKLRGAAVKDFDLQLTMSQGRLLVKVLRAAALGGNVVATGTTVDFSGTKPHFNLKAKLDKIDLAQVLALRSPEMGRKMTGRGTLDLNTDGQGLSWADIAPKLTGSLGMALTDGRLLTASLGSSVIAPLLAQAGGQLGGVAQSQQMALKDLAAQFKIENGQLRTTSPMRFTTEEGGISLSGSIGLDKSLAMLGDLSLSPKTISAATGGKLVPDRDIPVSLRIGGSLSKPEITLADPGKTVAALTEALLRGRGADLLKNLGGGKNPLGGALGGALGGQGKNLGGALGGQGKNLGGALGGPLGGALGGALGGQPAAGQPGQAQPPAQAPAQQDAKQRLEEEARKRLQGGAKGLGGLFGR